MAEKKEEKKDNPPAKEEPKAKTPFAKQVLEDAADEATKLAVNQLAKQIVKVMPDQMKQWIRSNPNSVQLLKALRILIPNDPLWGKVANEGLSDLVTKVLAELDKAEKTPPPAAAAKPAGETASDEATQYIRVCQATSALTQEKRDAFFLWLDGLSEENLSGFSQLTAKAKDQELKSYLEMNPRELARMIKAMPKAPRQEKPPTYLELRSAIAQDAETSQRVAALLARIGNADKFWRAVERQGFTSLAAFRLLLNLSDSEILSRLRLTSRLVGDMSKPKNRWDNLRVKISNRIKGGAQ